MLQRVMMPPPPVPCTARAKISMPMLTLTPAIKDPTQNTPTADNNTGFRPQMSDNFPQEGAAAALARRYAEPIHVYPDVEFKSAEIVGMATVTMVVSKAERKTAEQSDSMMSAFWSGVRWASGGTTLLPPSWPWAAAVAVAVTAAVSGTSCSDVVVDVKAMPTCSAFGVIAAPSVFPGSSCLSGLWRLPEELLLASVSLLLVVGGVFASPTESGKPPGCTAMVIMCYKPVKPTVGVLARLDEVCDPEYLILCPETGADGGGFAEVSVKSNRDHRHRV